MEFVIHSFNTVSGSNSLPNGIVISNLWIPAFFDWAKARITVA
jgi:hypothetical protein